MIYEVEAEGQTHMINVRRSPDGGWLLQVGDGPEEHILGERVDVAEWVFDFGGRRRSIGCHVDGNYAQVQISGYAMQVGLSDPRDKPLSGGSADSEGQVLTPMPGVIVRIGVAVGDVVTAGQVLLVVEAMKMENEHKCPIDGVVEGVHVAVGQAVESNTLLVSVVPE